MTPPHGAPSGRAGAERPGAPPPRLGVVGFGRLAQRYYVPAFRRLADARIVAVADPLPASRAAAERLLPGIVTHADHRAMLDSGGLDAVLVASPPSTHLEAWRDAVERDLPVFVEKPFLLDDQLARAAASSARARRRLMVNFNRRLWPTYRRLGELVRGGRIGRPRDAEFVLQSDVLAWCTVTRHRLSPSEGGVLADLGSQVLDLVPFVFGEEPATVSAEARTERWEADHVRLSLGFASGLSVRCEIAYTSRGGAERTVIRGSEGTLWLRNPNTALHLERPGALRARRLAGLGLDAVLLGYRGFLRDRSMLRSSVRASLAVFLRSLRAGAEAFAPGFDDGMRNVRWLEAARRSAAAGGRPEALGGTAAGLDRRPGATA